MPKNGAMLRDGNNNRDEVEVERIRGRLTRLVTYQNSPSNLDRLHNDRLRDGYNQWRNRDLWRR